MIGGFIIFGFLFGLVYNFVISMIQKQISQGSYILLAIISIILQAIVSFIVWRCAIAITFKKRLINNEDVKKVMKNLMIFIIIICILTAIMNFSEINSTIKENLESNSRLQLSEKYMSYIYDDEQMAEYQEQKEQAIKEVQNQLYTYLAVLEIGVFAVNIAVVLLQKNKISKYAV